MSGRSEILGTTISGRSGISFTWRDVFNDLTEKFIAGNYDSDEKPPSPAPAELPPQPPPPAPAELSPPRIRPEKPRPAELLPPRIRPEKSRPAELPPQPPPPTPVELPPPRIRPEEPRPAEGPFRKKRSKTLRILLCGFITSFIKNFIKNKKPAGKTSLERSIIKNTERASSTSSKPRLTTLGDSLIFPYKELKEATNNFEQKIGEGGFSSVYLGKLRDKRKVAVKKLYMDSSKRFEQFNNEVTVLSSLRHQNLVSLYGCTNPKTDKLLIVYEFVPNGTLASHLHGQRPPLSWALRIQIANETAMALAYLHSQVPPIIHRDVTSSNILLDNDFHAKVADLGLCRRFPSDAKSVTTQPQGTQGYRDPEYEQYCNLTDKSDVYSFGVVLLELISGEQAVDVNRKMSEIYLFKMALSKIVNKELEQLVDSRLGYDSESEIGRMINSVAELACVCLNPEANERLPMAEVHMALNEIKGGH